MKHRLFGLSKFPERIWKQSLHVLERFPLKHKRDCYIFFGVGELAKDESHLCLRQSEGEEDYSDETAAGIQVPGTISLVK